MYTHVYTSIYTGITGIYICIHDRYTQVYAGIHSMHMYTHFIQVYTGIKKYTQVSTPVHMSKHRYTKAYTGIN